jgi:polyhydroxyalkanoate synthesis regulator phasin
MTDIFEKTFYMGLGIISMTKDRAESLINELVESGKVSKEESSKAVRDLLDRAEKEKKAFDRRIYDTMEESVKRLHLARQSDIEEINKKLDALLKSQTSDKKTKSTKKTQSAKKS